MKHIFKNRSNRALIEFFVRFVFTKCVIKGKFLIVNVFSYAVNSVLASLNRNARVETSNAVDLIV